MSRLWNVIRDLLTTLTLTWGNTPAAARALEEMDRPQGDSTRIIDVDRETGSYVAELWRDGKPRGHIYFGSISEILSNEMKTRH
jgi:hypothetical protein